MSAMIDLSTVAAPAVVEPLDFEAVLAQLRPSCWSICPSWPACWSWRVSPW